MCYLQTSETNTLAVHTAPLPETKVPATDQTEFRIYRSIREAGPEWDLAAPEDKVFFQRDYLAALEQTPPQGIQFAYLLFIHNRIPAGVAICQIVDFNAAESVQAVAGANKGIFASLANRFKRLAYQLIKLRVVLCGNLLFTGEFAYSFRAALLSETAGMDCLHRGLQGLVQQLDAEGIRSSIILVKDIAPEKKQGRQRLQALGFEEVEIQPNMVMPLPFSTFEAYLGAMSTKYRTRAKRAFKKSEGIERRLLSLDELRQWRPVINDLYRQVIQKADFNAVRLREDYFETMLAQLPGKFEVHGYFRNGEMLAFYTTLLNGETLEAHYLGYDHHLNHDMQLYLNMLYDMVAKGIGLGCRELVFARTALEIKSSVGAVPQNLYCYALHRRPLWHRLMVLSLRWLKPEEQWTPRHPFK